MFTRPNHSADVMDAARPTRATSLEDPHLVDRAEAVARDVLGERPERVRHSAGVAERARLLTAAVPARHASLLVATAWLHDVGYASAAHRFGFHPLDGALLLHDMGWPPEVVALVAHHSGARYVGAVRGLSAPLTEFPYQVDALSDAVTVADQTAGPNGTPMSIDRRMQDMLDRHGAESPNALAHSRRRPYLLAAAARVATRLERAGVPAERHRIY